MDKKGCVWKAQSVQTSESSLLEFIRSIKGPKALTFEECSMAQWLYIVFKDEVDELVVCQPPGPNGPKTEIEAQNIAQLLRSRMLKYVFHADSNHTEPITTVSEIF